MLPQLDQLDVLHPRDHVVVLPRHGQAARLPRRRGLLLLLRLDGWRRRRGGRGGQRGSGGRGRGGNRRDLDCQRLRR